MSTPRAFNNLPNITAVVDIPEPDSDLTAADLPPCTLFEDIEGVIACTNAYRNRNVVIVQSSSGSPTMFQASTEPSAWHVRRVLGRWNGVDLSGGAIPVVEGGAQ